MGRAVRLARAGLARLIDHIADALRAAGCVFAEDEARIIAGSARDPDEADVMVARRAAGEPLEHVVGWAEFEGLRVCVGPGVFVPRRRSELLARVAVDRTPADGIVVELCCGVAAISAVIAAHRPAAAIHATDNDPVAVEYARVNLTSANATTYVGDLHSPLPQSLRGRVDLIVANAPYVPTSRIASLPAEARLHEPLGALDGGVDGTDVQRRVAQEAPDWLAPLGALVIETSAAQAESTCGHLRDAGLVPHVISEDARDALVVVASRPD